MRREGGCGETSWLSIIRYPYNPDMSGIPFIKMHGLGNDFVVIDTRANRFDTGAANVRAVADRRLGVGCDQLIIIAPPRASGGDVFMGIYNADGEEVDACGNATRCIARLLMDEAGRDRVTVETNIGLLACRDGGDGMIVVDMGSPRFDWEDIPLEERMDTRHVDIKIGPIDAPVLAFPSAVNVGNPHCIFFVENIATHDPTAIGPMVENHPMFPQRTNVSFAQIRARDDIRVRVWERGVGMTRACGTAACAVVAAAARSDKDLADRTARVELDGGVLQIDWREADGHIHMTGPTAISFRGEFDPSILAGEYSAL